MPMSDTELESAVARAGALLRESRAPVIAGLAADVAGIVAAFRLAEKIGAAIDHTGAEWALRDQAVLQDAGLMLVGPGEARRSADAFLVVGDRPLQAWPELSDSVFVASRPVVTLTSHDPNRPEAACAWLRASASDLPSLLAALRARLNGRPLARDFARTAEVERAAAMLKAASFGVALWSPDEIDVLTIEMLTGLIKDLNATTRWSGLSVSPSVTQSAAAMASGWMTGLPLRTSFARGRPAHDPWQYDARRLAQSGEADAILWIDAFGDPLPEWLHEIPSVLLVDTGHLEESAAITLPIGRPGRDHDGVVYDRATGTLVEIVAQTPTGLPSAAEILIRIAAAASPP
jgi:formylmethanofuran dehydrogenase subunit B